MSTVKTDELKKQVSLTGVDSGTVSKLNSTYTPSANVTQAQANAGNSLNTLQTNANNAANNGYVSQDTWNKINSNYTQSKTVTDAYKTTQSLLDKLTSGRTSYSDRVDQMIDSIMARENFSYDPDTDTLFQQKLASSINAGKSAMQDTMGQASQLTGGYGSTYATSAANQAYNDYLTQAYDSLPEYYQMARDTYQMDVDNDYKKYGMLSNADDREYNRTYTAWNANNTNWQQLYNQEYNQYQNSISNALNSAGLQINEGKAVTNAVQGAYGATQQYSDSLYNREYGQYKDELSNAYNLASLESSDYWKRYNASKSGSSTEKAKSLTTEQLKAAERKMGDDTLDQYGAYYNYLKNNGYDVSQLDDMYGSLVYDYGTGKYTSSGKQQYEANKANAEKEAYANQQEASQKSSEAMDKKMSNAQSSVDSYLAKGYEIDDAVDRAGANLSESEKEELARRLVEAGYFK